jgi:hypothetical protein
MDDFTLDNCTCLGSAGYEIAADTPVDLKFSSEGITYGPGFGKKVLIPYFEISSMSVGGPGATTTGGGFIGGGFGVEGALGGIALASILNRLTTKSKIYTFLTIITNVGELHFHYSGMEPGALRIALAGAYAALRRTDSTWVGERLSCLEAQKALGTLTDAELEKFKARLLNAPAQRIGQCSNCMNLIPLTSAQCPACKQKFYAGSAWKVAPI